MRVFSTRSWISSTVAVPASPKRFSRSCTTFHLTFQLRFYHCSNGSCSFPDGVVMRFLSNSANSPDLFLTYFILTLSPRGSSNIRCHRAVASVMRTTNNLTDYLRFCIANLIISHHSKSTIQLLMLILEQVYHYLKWIMHARSFYCEEHSKIGDT